MHVSGGVIGVLALPTWVENQNLVSIMCSIYLTYNFLMALLSYLQRYALLSISFLTKGSWVQVIYEYSAIASNLETFIWAHGCPIMKVTHLPAPHHGTHMHAQLVDGSGQRVKLVPLKLEPFLLNPTVPRPVCGISSGQ